MTNIVTFTFVSCCFEILLGTVLGYQLTVSTSFSKLQFVPSFEVCDLDLIATLARTTPLMAAQAMT